MNTKRKACSRIPVLTFFGLTVGCTERVVDLDATPVVNVRATEQADDSVVVVLNEQVVKLQTDGVRLFWFGQSSAFACEGRRTWALRSCAIAACADTLVTYVDASATCTTPEDIQDTAGRQLDASVELAAALSGFVAVGERVYWGSPLRSCPIQGCEAHPTQSSATALGFEHAVRGDLYWLDSGEGRALSRCVPERCDETTQVVADVGKRFFTTAQSLTFDESHAYWIVGSEIQRVALDGRSPAETIVEAVQPSGLTVAGQYVYWARRSYPGALFRCSVSGCGPEGPTEVVGKQTYPNWTGHIGGSLLWTNSNDAFTGTETQLRTCLVEDCANSVHTIEPESKLILGHWIHGDTIYFGTTNDMAATTVVRRRQF